MSKNPREEFSPRYIVDEMGQQTEVILSVKNFKKLLEVYEDAYYGAAAEKALKDGDFVDFEEANKEILKK